MHERGGKKAKDRVKDRVSHAYKKGPKAGSHTQKLFRCKLYTFAVFYLRA